MLSKRIRFGSLRSLAPGIGLAGSFLLAVCAIGGAGSDALAQDWGREEEDRWQSRDPYDSYDPRYDDPYEDRREERYDAYGDRPASGLTAWSVRAGFGFTNDPTNFLMNFEIPYAFDRFVSLGPMVQVGLSDNKLLVAPTANLTIRVPDLPGEEFDRFHPIFFTGIGLAVLENDDRAGDNSAVGFLVNFGLGLEYQVSARVATASRMIFNFLPEDVLDDEFFYAWEILGIKLTF